MNEEEKLVPAFQKHDLSHKRRTLVAGDIHGRFDLLKTRLEELEYDEALDQLVLLGDLVDRGHLSHECLEWVRPGILRVLGNHEELVAMAAIFPHHPHGYCRHELRKNGGAWFDDLSAEEMERHGRLLYNAPAALEITTAGGHTVGIVHAAVPGRDWADLRNKLSTLKDDKLEVLKHDVIWERDQIETLLAKGETWGITGISHVFFGHECVPQPLRHKNCSWIDTKAWKSGNLTVIDIDQWLTK